MPPRWDAIKGNTIQVLRALRPSPGWVACKAWLILYPRYENLIFYVQDLGFQLHFLSNPNGLFNLDPGSAPSLKSSFCCVTD
jgi:hypothetical protein